MDGVDPFSSSMVDRYQLTLDESAKKGLKVRALLIVNPNNSLGRCYPPSKLKASMKFCQKNSIHLISDEVYASVLSIDRTDVIDPNLLHVFYGFRKDFAAAGLRLGSLITQDTLLHKAVTANVRFHNPSGPSVAIGTVILEDRKFVASFIDLFRTRLRKSRAYAASVLDGAGIEYDKSANAGFFLYVDLSPWLPAKGLDASKNAQEYALAQKLLDGGVGLHLCEEHFELKGHFRLIFSQEHEVLAEGLRRLVSILGPRTHS